MAIFRRYELVIGFLLGVAVSAFVAVIYNQYQDQNRQTNQRTDQRATDPGFWEKTTSDPTAFFTASVAVFTLIYALSTIGLWIVTWRSGVRQSRDMQDSLQVSRDAANAAKQAAEAAELQAKAVIGIERPVVLVQSYDVRAPAGTPETERQPLPERPILYCTIINYGRTPAELESFSLRTRIAKDLPDTPDYESIRLLPSGTMLRPQEPMTLDPEMFTVGRMRDDLLKERVFLWVYGFVRYRDFLGQQHETHFAAKGLAIFEGARWFMFVQDPETPSAYSQRI